MGVVRLVHIGCCCCIISAVATRRSGGAGLVLVNEDGVLVGRCHFPHVVHAKECNGVKAVAVALEELGRLAPGEAAKLSNAPGIPSSLGLCNIVCIPAAEDVGVVDNDKGHTAVHAFVKESQETKTVSDATYARAVAAIGEEGVVDVVGIVGYYCLVSMTLNIFGVNPPPGAKTEMG